MKKEAMKNSAFQDEVKRVSKILRKEIYAGHRMPQEHLTESKLAQSYSANRMVIRQVLSELAATGLVSIEPYKGASVASVTIDKILETYDVVAMLEGFSAKKAAEYITEEDIHQLTVNLELQKAVDPGDTRQWQSLNYGFHRIINRRCGNQQIIRLIRQNSQFTNYWFLSMPQVDFKPAIKAHEKILEALKARNGNKARKYMEKHITIRVKRLVDHIQKSIPLGMFRSA